MPVRTLALVGAAVLLLAPGVGAQDIRWGRISDAEIALDSVAGDPDATAVILADTGFDELTPQRRGIRLERRRHRRVKVLTEAGYKHGEFSLRHADDDRVRDIRAQTFVPRPDGTMDRVELDRKSVFREKVRDGVEEVRFTMPALAPGAIFEIQYTYETDNFVTLPAWYFQTDEPTLFSEYRASIPGFLSYVTIRQGPIEDHPVGRGNRIDTPTSETRWTARDLPALRDEPYTTTEEDYTTRIELQLSRIVPPGGIPEDVLTSWAEVAKTLGSHDAFGRRLRSSKLRRAQVEDVTGTREERARAVYDMVRTGYVSNGRGGIFAGRDLNDVVETRSGTAPELALLLASLLREADVPAELALISTRPNGRPVELYPLVNQFDWVVVQATMEDGTRVLLDPTDRHRPYGVLPVHALNGRAWLASEGAPVWFDVPATTGTATTSFVEAALAPNGSLAGTLQLRLEGYDAERARDEMLEAQADAPARAAAEAEAIAEAADADDGVEVLSVEVEGLDDVASPLMVRSTFVGSGGEAIGDELYLTPFVMMQLDKNPFERPTRLFPVDFAFPFSRTYVASITLPEGYGPDELPAPIRLTTPSRTVSYTRVVGGEPGRLLVRAVLSVDRSQVSADEYPALRRLYDEIVAAEAEAVVLVRTGEPGPPPPPAPPVADEADAGEAEPAADAGGDQ